jgi:hypothetical protein
MKRIKIYLVMVLLLLTGCFTDEVFERPVIISISPSSENNSVRAESKIVVEFSKTMDMVKTNEEFSLSTDSGRVDGLYAWDGTGRVMTFTPGTSLKMGEKYTVRITENAEDAEGNDLAGVFLSVFYTGGDLGQPFVVSSFPAANSIGNPENSVVTITFSEPVDLNSIYSGITVTPSVQGYFEAGAAPGTVIFTPLYGFSYGTTYKVSISDNVRDTAGNRLLYSVEFSFTVGDDFIKPGLSAYQDLASPLYFDESRIIHGAEKNKSIILDFSELILTDNISGAVTISPSVPFYINTIETENNGAAITRGIINFTESLSSEVTYTLRINSTVRDIQGNPLDHDYRFVFVTDGPGTVMPVVVGIGDIDSENNISFWQPAGEIKVLDAGGGSGLYDNIGVEFSASMAPYSMVINIETVAGNGGTPVIVNMDWPESGSNTFSKFSFGLMNISSGNTYKLIIKGGKNGLKDSSGNNMKQDFIQLIRF